MTFTEATFVYDINKMFLARSWFGTVGAFKESVEVQEGSMLHTVMGYGPGTLLITARLH